MKIHLILQRLVLLLIFLFIPLGLSGCRHFQIQSVDYTDGTYKLMTYNIKTYMPKAIEMENEYWHNRKRHILAQIEQASPDILCLQEVRTNQYDDLLKTLKSYQSIYYHRKFDDFNPEGLAIFYRSDRFELESTNQFWLSDTPDTPSIGWNSHYERFCIFIHLTEISTQQSFWICNTHLDYAKEKIRQKSLDLIDEQLAQSPSFILGDFNFQEGSNDYQYATQLFLDAKYEALITRDAPTFNNYGSPTPVTICDYIFIKNNCFQVEFYNVLNEVFDGQYASDHYAVIIQAHLNKKSSPLS
ncbi:MAG: endonuclease/exonuclease/phosphatase family protein [Prevotella sp.]|nr:endonuclease/exonuclease/phosphatase family protein [Staphylococcus sp.]MCM1349600.1 endonuclease/exonuclease/phosphatase family protein [Prevotella sp.]